MESLTELEKEIMISIPKDCFYTEELDSQIWTDCLLDDIKMDNKIARGVLSSLVKKGYIEVTSGKDSILYYTEKGKEYMKEVI